jgi:hypothetical protein
MKTQIVDASFLRLFDMAAKLAVFAFGALVAPLGAQDTSPGSELAPAEAVRDSRPEKSDTASTRLIQNFLTVAGGKDAYDRLRNVVATGVIKEGHQTRNFKLVETQDGKRHLTYWWRHLARDYEEVYVFDGVQTWSQKRKPELEAARQFGGRRSAHFSRQRWLLQPFVLPCRADYVFEYQGTGRVGDRRTHVVVGYGKKNERSWFYFDQEKFLLLRWGGVGLIGGVEEPLDYRSLRFKSVGGVLLPAEIELLAEEAVFGRVTFESIEANQNLRSIRFLMPEVSSPLLRQRPASPD